ncbi:MAG: hypothetical protein JXO72_10165 [Vicinamibacteria bacterium]|nr:hypothetical protein [Vicinamibacteria bacterium]
MLWLLIVAALLLLIPSVLLFDFLLSADRIDRNTREASAFLSHEISIKRAA